MLFYRQKILLGLLEALGDNVSATDFQKHLFMYTTLCERDKSFEFVPYRFGCFSFQATVDKQKLTEKGYLAESKNWLFDSQNLNYLSSLQKSDSHKIKMFAERYGALRGKALIQHVYRSYPYYAINSEIAEEYLDENEYSKVCSSKPLSENRLFFGTIGYEGGSVESYLNRLIQKQVHVLVDVRKNPVSRKYGFSKRTLSSLLDKFNIEYVHFPQLGIESSDRKSLNSQSDYDRLFDSYEAKTLSHQKDALRALYQILVDKKRIAITCFEKNHYQCHRGRVASAIEKISNGEVTAAHI